MRTVIVKVGSLYVTSDGSLSSAQSDALRIDVPGSHDPNVVTPQPRVVTLKTNGGF